ncbi:MAG: hypothetical protein MHM6MM_000477 [Cercozoa sp. M6MM]
MTHKDAMVDDDEAVKQPSVEKNVEDDEEDEVEKEEPRNHLLQLGQLKYKLRIVAAGDESVSAEAAQEARDEALELVKEHRMPQEYIAVCELLEQTPNAELVAEMKRKNEEELAKIDEEVAKTQEEEGESEVQEQLFKRAKFLAGIGRHEAAHEALVATLEKTVGNSSRLTVVFEQIRLALAWHDWERLTPFMDTAEKLADEGGDWEQRNRLKVYRAVHALVRRDLDCASELFVDALQTFSATELMSHSDLVFYTVVCAVLCLPRVQLGKSVVDAPEILQSVDQVPELRSFLYKFHQCDFASFFRAMLVIMQRVQQDAYLGAHWRYCLRELRLVAYRQFLAAYRSVRLDAMASAFGVGPEFLDEDLARYIATGRLNAKLDKVKGVVQRFQADQKNAQFKQVLTSGDLVLTRIQKLSRVIAL